MIQKIDGTQVIRVDENGLDVTAYIQWGEKVVTLDGDFTVDDLRQIVSLATFGMGKKSAEFTLGATLAPMCLVPSEDK